MREERAICREMRTKETYRKKQTGRSPDPHHSQGDTGKVACILLPFLFPVCVFQEANVFLLLDSEKYSTILYKVFFFGLLPTTERFLIKVAFYTNLNKWFKNCYIFAFSHFLYDRKIRTVGLSPGYSSY